MANLLNALLEITIYSGILFLVIIAFKKIFYRHISASLSYLVWFLLIARLLMPVTIDSGIKWFVIPAEQKPVVQTETDTSANTMLNTNVPEYLPSSPRLQNESTDIYATGSGLRPAVQTKDAVNINWETAVVFIWALGMLIYLAYIVFLNIRFRRVIRRSATSVPPWVSETMEACRKELGIKARICVSVQISMVSPALTLSVHPALLLPESMIKHMSREQIRLGVLHELTHYKRGDHIISLLLMFLRGIYWFNPLVWITNKMMLADMEAACDARVTARLEKKQKLLYINTILDLGSDRFVKYALGMGTPAGKKSMERRIRSMFMKKKSAHSARLAAFLLVPIMLVMCFTTACQPTPQKAIVVGKDTDKMLSMAQQSNVTADTKTLKETMKIPDHYAYEAQSKSGLVKLKAAADISVPNVAAMPVERIKMHMFTQQDADKLVKALIRGNPIYEAPQYTVFTKAQLEERIVEAKKILAGDDYQGLTRKDWEDKIKWYEDKLPNAPETLEDAKLKLSDGKLTKAGNSKVYEYLKNPDYEYLNILANLGNSYLANLHISNDLVHKYIQAYFSSGWNWDGMPKASALILSQQQAQQQAGALLKELGYDDMVLNQCFKDTASAPAHETWVLDFVRQIHGIPVSTESEHANMQIDDGSQKIQNYTPNWPAEILHITIDDEGIQGLQWDAPYDIEQEVSKNANLLSFDKIQQRFEEMFFVEKSDTVLFDKGIKYNIQFVIDKVELTLMRISEKDSPDTSLLVPVWFFHGYTQSDLSKPGADLSTVSKSERMIIMKINALDGSIID